MLNDLTKQETCLKGNKKSKKKTEVSFMKVLLYLTTKNVIYIQYTCRIHISKLRLLNLGVWIKFDKTLCEYLFRILLLSCTTVTLTYVFLCFMYSILLLFFPPVLLLYILLLYVLMLYVCTPVVCMYSCCLYSCLCTHAVCTPVVCTLNI